MTERARWRLLTALEGPVVDPVPGLLASLRWALARGGQDVPPDADLGWALDAELDDALRRLLGARYAALGDFVAEQFRRRYDEKGRFEGCIHDGMPELLGALARREDIETVLLTAWPRAEVSRQLAQHGLEDAFHTIACTSERGCARCRRDLARVVSGGNDSGRPSSLWLTDDPDDVAAARRQGIASMAALWGRSTAAELAPSAPTLWARRPADVLAALPPGAAGSIAH